MILFVTSSDDNTLPNFEIIKQIQQKPNYLQVFAMDATKINFVRTTSYHKDKNIFIASHGSFDRIVCNNETEYILTSDCAAINDRKIFVYACKTGLGFGKIISIKNNIYFGYLESIHALECRYGLNFLYARLFSYILDNLPNIIDLQSAINLIETLKNVAEEVTNEIETRGIEDLGIYKSLRDIWRLLTVWYNGENHHPFYDQMVVYPELL